MTIQWFPGHMSLARKKAAETMEWVDVVIEVVAVSDLLGKVAMQPFAKVVDLVPTERGKRSLGIDLQSWLRMLRQPICGILEQPRLKLGDALGGQGEPGSSSVPTIAYKQICAVIKRLNNAEARH